jgi:surface protein
MNITCDNMFALCSDLTEISFSPLFNNIEIKSVKDMFAQCSSLTSIDFTNFKIMNVTILDVCFIDVLH